MKLAHLNKNNSTSHNLEEHLIKVGELASFFGKKIGVENSARVAGIWHDLGKYSDAFQKMLTDSMDLNVQAPKEPVDHSTAGAIHAINTKSLPIALAIASHHAGLPDPEDFKQRMAEKKHLLEEALKGELPNSILNQDTSNLENFGKDKLDVEMKIRMLLSVLCDADFLDTEDFFSSFRKHLRINKTTLEELNKNLDTYISKKESLASVSKVNSIRKEIRETAIKSIAKPKGFFSLSAPTGTGKSLSGLSFALNHAIKHNLDRVITVLPFTVLIEQTVKTYKEALNSSEIIEHHSNIDPDRDTIKNRLASENWSAPVVVTTTVQFFESLLSNRPGRCRKLHNIANSMIILDEAQSFPPELLETILHVLSQLVKTYGCSVLITTATLPAFHKFLGSITEILPNFVKYHNEMKRVKVKWPSEDKINWSDLSKEISKEEDVLVITHLRDDARDLCLLLDENTFHLSALMCPAHREEIFNQIKNKAGPRRVVSTQLIEAGVDLDFKVVYRALGGLDSLAQAAGRCNREGRHEFGELRVYRAPTQPPPGLPKMGLAISSFLLADNPNLNPFDSSSQYRYFSKLYKYIDTDKSKIQEAREQFRFKTVASLFKLIEDDWSFPLIIPYNNDSNDLIKDLRDNGPSFITLRKLQRYVVNVPNKYLQHTAVECFNESYYILTDKTKYDSKFGLTLTMS